MTETKQPPARLNYLHFSDFLSRCFYQQDLPDCHICIGEYVSS